MLKVGAGDGVLADGRQCNTPFPFPDGVRLPTQIRQRETEKHVTLGIVGVRPALLLEPEPGGVGVDSGPDPITPKVIELGQDDAPRAPIVVERAQRQAEHLALLGIIEDPVQVLEVGEIAQQRRRLDPPRSRPHHRTRTVETTLRRGAASG